MSFRRVPRMPLDKTMNLEKPRVHGQDTLVNQPQQYIARGFRGHRQHDRYVGCRKPASRQNAHTAVHARLKRIQVAIDVIEHLF